MSFAMYQLTTCSSFLIGGDGLVYEARGWNVEPHRPLLYEDLGTTGIEIGYIGDFEGNCNVLAMIIEL